MAANFAREIKPPESSDSTMYQSFSADAPFRKTVLFAEKLLLLTVVLTGFNITVGLKAKATLSVSAVGIAIAAISVYGRRAWGDQLTLTPDSIVTAKAGVEKQRFPIQSIDSITVKNDAVAIAWREADKRRSIVIGKERFNDDTWLSLSSALSSLGVQDKCKV